MSFSNSESWSWPCGDWPSGPTKPLWPGGRMVSASMTRADAGVARRTAKAATVPARWREFTGVIKHDRADGLQQSTQRPEVQIQVLGGEPELLTKLIHPLVQLHERAAEPLDLLLAQIPAVDPAQRLSLHDLPEQLDDRQDELRQAALDVLGIGIHAPRQRVVEPRRVPCKQVEILGSV